MRRPLPDPPSTPSGALATVSARNDLLKHSVEVNFPTATRGFDV